MSFQNVSLLILLVAFEANDQDAKLHGVLQWPLDAIGHYSIWVCQVWLFCYV